MKKIFFTDGSSKGNPGPGGYGVVWFEDTEKTIYEENVWGEVAEMSLPVRRIYYKNNNFFEETTNNRMELMAILEVIKMAKDDPDNEYLILSDSAYAVRSINEWMPNWANNGWLNSKNQPVENMDIMKEIYSYIYYNMYNVEIQKINGHCGIIGNELADALATGDEDKFTKIIKHYHIREVLT